MIGGKNKEIVRIKNLENIPIPFSFTKDSVLGELDYADSLIVSPMVGVIQADSEI